MSRPGFDRTVLPRERPLPRRSHSTAARLARGEGNVKRPFGITVLAIIFAAAGLSYMMLGFQMTTAVTFGPIPPGRARGSGAG